VDVELSAPLTVLTNWAAEVRREVKMQNELDILREVSDRLESAGIAFMLTGSVAMNYYAQPLSFAKTSFTFSFNNLGNGM
jgi:hypothetical protein